MEASLEAVMIIAAVVIRKACALHGLFCLRYFYRGNGMMTLKKKGDCVDLFKSMEMARNEERVFY